MSDDIQSIEANFGEKTIEVRLRFFTNSIADIKGHVLPKHCWPVGMATMPKNDSHGIRNVKPHPFHSLEEISSVVEEILADAGIAVH